MHIKQFYDTGLAHASYILISHHEAIVVDPARNPEPYLAFLRENHAKLMGIIETHPHADFVSAHVDLHQQTGAAIYTSKLVGAAYPHHPFDDGDKMVLGKLTLKAINTPGHSPDSICVLVLDEKGRQQALFTGDTLFVGDVGRPDLRENAGHVTAKAQELAQALYHTLHQKIALLDPHVTIYPAHGAGSLCGKGIRDEKESTIGQELKENEAFQQPSEEAFVAWLMADQPFVPKYFAFDVALNRAGALPLSESLTHITPVPETILDDTTALLIDSRPNPIYRIGHRPDAIHLPDGTKFETWLGSIIAPGESFYLLVTDEMQAQALLMKTAKIGYESQCKGFIVGTEGTSISPQLDLNTFKEQPEAYTIIDLRNEGEVQTKKIFKTALSIPLPRLRESLDLIPTDKPIVVHCAGGYRSAIGTSIIAARVNIAVYDLGTAVEEFK